VYIKEQSNLDQTPNGGSDEIVETPIRKIPETIVPAIPIGAFRRLEILESDGDLGTGFRSGSQKRSGLKLGLWTWLSASIDGLVLVSLSCFFMIAFSFLMKTSPSVLFSFVKNQSTEATIAMLFLVSLWSYLIFMRAFIGASIGEWSCDLRLGEPVQRFNKTYLLRVILRTTLIVMTGIFVLPLISLITKKDIAGLISGVRIYSLQ
jgi:succinate dehydrogenase hydrophobic anchor subunit